MFDPHLQRYQKVNGMKSAAQLCRIRSKFKSSTKNIFSRRESCFVHISSMFQVYSKQDTQFSQLQECRSTKEKTAVQTCTFCFLGNEAMRSFRQICTEVFSQETDGKPTQTYITRLSSYLEIVVYTLARRARCKTCRALIYLTFILTCIFCFRQVFLWRLNYS